MTLGYSLTCSVCITMALVNGGEAERLATINIYPLKLIELQKKQDVKCEQLLVHIKITLVSFRMHLTTN